MFDLELFNDNSELRDNVLNDGLNDIDLFSGLNSDVSTNLVKAFKGVGFNNNGDIVGADGKVALSAKDVRTHLKTHYESINDVNPLDFESIVVDGVSLKINDKGEAIDAAGKVVKSFDEVKSLLKSGNIINGAPDPTDIAGIIAAANEASGIDFVDENGNAISFEPTVEGMAARDRYMIDTIAQQMVKDTIDRVLKADPDFESLYLYKQQNKSAIGWAPGVDYNSIVVLKPTDPAAEKQYEDLIIKAEVARGASIDRAKALAKYAIEDGKGEAFALESLDVLKQQEQLKLENSRVAAQKAKDDEQARVTKYYDDIKNVINSGKAMGVTIPSFIPVKDESGVIRHVPRQVFFDYISKPVQDGKSAYQIRRSGTTPEEVVIDALMKFTGYDNSSIIKAGIAQQKVEAVRKIKTGGAAGNGGRGAGTSGRSPVDMVILD